MQSIFTMFSFFLTLLADFRGRVVLLAVHCVWCSAPFEVHSRWESVGRPRSRGSRRDGSRSLATPLRSCACECRWYCKVCRSCMAWSRRNFNLNWRLCYHGTCIWQTFKQYLYLAPGSLKQHGQRFGQRSRAAGDRSFRNREQQYWSIWCSLNEKSLDKSIATSAFRNREQQYWSMKHLFHRKWSLDMQVNFVQSIFFWVECSSMVTNVFSRLLRSVKSYTTRNNVFWLAMPYRAF